MGNYRKAARPRVAPALETLTESQVDLEFDHFDPACPHYPCMFEEGDYRESVDMDFVGAFRLDFAAGIWYLFAWVLPEPFTNSDKEKGWAVCEEHGRDLSLYVLYRNLNEVA